MATSDLLDAKKVKAQDKKRQSQGYMNKTPTVNSLPGRLMDLQQFYKDRNSMMQRHIRMSRLDNPFSTDKDGMENTEMRVKADGTLDYTVDNSPYNIVTIAQAMIAEMHPYADVYPTNQAHTETRMEECKRFVQALLDTLMKEGDVPQDMANKLVVCGWLPTLTVFDPAKLKQGNNPFQLRVLDPINFYPLLNAQRQVIYGFYVERVTGAQLVQDYYMFDGVAELAEAENPPDKGSSAYENYNRYNHNFETTEFDVVRFYDDTSTALMISVEGASATACNYNPVLAKRKKLGKDNGSYTSLFYSTEDLEGDPYLGLQKHGLGGQPYHLVGCFEEALSPTAKTNTDVGSLGNGNIYETIMGGKMVYYPFLYPIYNDWIDRSRYRNMMHMGIDAWARPTTIFYTENQEYYKNAKQGDTIFMSPDGQEKREVEPPRPMPPEFMTIFSEFGNSIASAAFNTGSNGGRMPNSARGYEAALNQGTKREKVLIRKIQQCLSAYCEMAIRILIKRGGIEEAFVAGDGRAFGGAYTLTYKADALKGFVPSVEVELKLLNGLKDPNNVTAFSALQKLGAFSDKYLLGRVLDEPNPEAIIQDAMDEKFKTEQSVIAPAIEVAALEAVNKYLEDKYKWTTKNSLKEDQLEDELNHKKVEQDWAQLSQDEKDAKMQAAIQMAISKAASTGVGGDSSQSPGSTMSPGSQPPSMPSGATGPQTPMPSMASGPMPASSMSPPAGGMPPGGMPMMPGARPPLPLPPPPSAGSLPFAGRGMPMPMGQPGGFPPPSHPMPPMPMPLPPSPAQMRLPMPPAPPSNAGLPPGFAKAPGQAVRPVQPLSQFGMGRTGVPSELNPAAGLHGQMIDTPAFEEANKAFAPMDAKVQGAMGRPRKRGSRGKGGKR